MNPAPSKADVLKAAPRALASLFPSGSDLPQVRLGLFDRLCKHELNLTWPTDSPMEVREVILLCRDRFARMCEDMRREFGFDGDDQSFLLLVMTACEKEERQNA